MIKNIIIGVLFVLVLVFAGLYFGNAAALGANTSEYNVKEFLNTVTFSGTTSMTGAVTASGALTATADVRVKAPVLTGAIGGIAGTTSSVITAAQVCDRNYATTTPSITEASTLTTPAMSTLVSDCMTTNGDVRELTILNTTASTTVVTAGASSTLYYDGSTGGSATLAASSLATLRFIRTSATTMLVMMYQAKP